MAIRAPTTIIGIPIPMKIFLELIPLILVKIYMKLMETLYYKISKLVIADLVIEYITYGSNEFLNLIVQNILDSS